MRPATKSLLILFRSKTEYYGFLINPSDGDMIDKDGAGIHEIIGKFRDMGYQFSTISEKVPQWVIKHIPNQYTTIGCLPVISAPIFHPKGCECDICRDKIYEDC